MNEAGRALLCLGMMAVLARLDIADAKPPGRIAEPVRQIALTEDKINQYLAARPALDAILADVPGAGAADPRLMHALNDAARKSGFADYADYESVATNVVWILTGIDPLSRKYIGIQAVTKLELAPILADKSLLPKERKARLEALHAQMQSAAPVRYPTNVPLVTKFYDRLFEASAKE